MSKVTQWFDGNVDPVRVGPYQRKYWDAQNILSCDYWDGKIWKYDADGSCGECINQNRPWRGLADNPKGKS